MKIVEIDLVTKRIQISQKVCMDYRNVKTNNRKDHFAFPFIDKRVERLVGHTSYCLFYGLGYNQISIAPED